MAVKAQVTAAPVSCPSRRPGRGEPGDRQVPGQVSHPARTRSRASTATRCAHQRRMQDGARLGQRGIWPASPGRRLIPAAQSAKSPGTPPDDDDLMRPPRTWGGGRQPALPAGQQPARGALGAGTGPRRASARERQGLPPTQQHPGHRPRTWLDRYVARAQDCPR
jgi:hypothetical protein